MPLDPAHPDIENKMDVHNRTSNRHGIAGYLDDKEVARRIYDAFVAFDLAQVEARADKHYR